MHNTCLIFGRKISLKNTINELLRSKKMFAVVVLLIKPREHIIVPEGYILGLTDLEDDLKTWGANKTHDHLIFWSNNLLDENIVPDEAIAPDFTFARCEVFPPPAPSDAGCYIGRIKRFFSKNNNKISFLIMCVFIKFVCV